jgi:hypothetical protein
MFASARYEGWDAPKLIEHVKQLAIEDRSEK